MTARDLSIGTEGSNSSLSAIESLRTDTRDCRHFVSEPVLRRKEKRGSPGERVEARKDMRVRPAMKQDGVRVPRGYGMFSASFCERHSKTGFDPSGERLCGQIHRLLALQAWSP